MQSLSHWTTREVPMLHLLAEGKSEARHAQGLRRAPWEAGRETRDGTILCPQHSLPAPSISICKRDERKPRMGMPAPLVQSYLGIPSTCLLPSGPHTGGEIQQDASKCCGHCVRGRTPGFVQKLGTGALSWEKLPAFSRILLPLPHEKGPSLVSKTLEELAGSRWPCPPCL